MNGDVKAGWKSSEAKAGGVLAIFLAAKEQLGIDWMDPEVITAITWIIVTYIIGRSVYKSAVAIAQAIGSREAPDKPGEE